MNFRVWPLLWLIFCLSVCTGVQAAPVGLDTDWRLLLDDHAKWQDDTLYLPDEVDLAHMPVNAPTGGWAALNEHSGISVTLPSTVEEHYWGKSPSGVANSAKPSDIVGASGNYVGVSWWYHSFTAPALRAGEHLIFSFRGARLRSEVYVNGKLVGYNLITEAPFTADATPALKLGQDNQIAVRITNPGGRLDWIDFLTMQWGKYRLPATHAFGGIDGGVTMDVRGAVSVGDLSVFNKPNPKSVTLAAEIDSSGVGYHGPVALTIARNGKRVWSGSVSVDLLANGKVRVSKDVTVSNAELWDVGHPVLYDAMAVLPKIMHSERHTTFGFRWFTAEGIGTDARLVMNGHRIVPRSSISWGFWAPNGLFPDQQAADREVAAVRALGLDSIQNHRHMPKPIVLDTFDRAGLLRYCEPGGGLFSFADDQGEQPVTLGAIDTSGIGGDATSFLNRYELAKVLAMIHANRSHPSVTIWSLQNEISPDLHNPKIFSVLRKMREADPSRIIMLKSGIFVQNQVWSLPYSQDWLYDNGKGVSGWWDQHTATSSAGVYRDSQYKSPTDFQYNSSNRQEIVTWGEMATGASPDNHVADIAWYNASGKSGYDLEAHKALVGSYESFLDMYHFRTAFPTVESLFQSAGNKHYFSAAHLLENARIADANDYLVLSGWESTTIDDHSGLTDSLRFLKGDPALLKQASASDVLVVRPRKYVVAKGTHAVIDIHLVNETNLHGSFRLTLMAALPGEKPFFTTTVPVTVIGGDTFGQLLKADVEFPANEAGSVTLTAALAASVSAVPVLRRTEPLLIVDTQPVPLAETVAVNVPSVGMALQTQFGLASVPLTPAPVKLDRILVVSENTDSKWQEFNTPNLPIDNTNDPDLYRYQRFGPAGKVQIYRGLAPGQVKVDLFFAENYWTDAGQRVFDMALNGKTVLKDFDIVKEAGGKGHALVKSFVVDDTEGTLTITVPKVKANNASLAAVRITDGAGTVIRSVFRTNAFKDQEGNVWNPIPGQNFDWTAFLAPLLMRVHDDGTRLILLTSGGSDAGSAAAALADQNILTYSGMAGDPGSSWLGFWYFGHKHWLLDGLPTDGVLDWPYQIANGNGLFLKGLNVDAVIGYGKNHDPNIGVGVSVISYGRGQILLLCLPGLANAFMMRDDSGMQSVTAKRMIYNALR